MALVQVGRTVNVTVRICPAGIAPSCHSSVLAVRRCGSDAETNVVPDGTVSVTVTLVAALVLGLRMVRVYWKSCPLDTNWLAGVLVSSSVGARQLVSGTTVAGTVGALFTSSSAPN